MTTVCINFCALKQVRNHGPANMKTSWRHREDVFHLPLQKTSSGRLQDVLIKTDMLALTLRLQRASSRRLGQDQFIRLQNVFKTSCQDVFKTFWRRLQDNFKTSSRRLKNVFKTSDKRLQDVLQKSLQDVFKASSRRFQDVSSSSTLLINTSLRSIEHVSETFFSKDGYLQIDLPR